MNQVAASSIKTGDTIIWNFGLTSVVASVEQVSSKFVLIYFTNGTSRRTGSSKLMQVAA